MLLVLVPLLIPILSPILVLSIKICTVWLLLGWCARVLVYLFVSILAVTAWPSMIQSVHAMPHSMPSMIHSMHSRVHSSIRLNPLLIIA